MENSDPAPVKKEDKDRGGYFVFLAALLWSLAGVFIKFLDLHPLTITFYRSLFAALVFLPFVKWTDGSISAPIFFSAASYSAAIIAFVTANKLTTAANAIVLQYTAPLFVFLYARMVLRQTIAKPYAIALTVSMAGVAVISLDTVGDPQMAGVLLALASGVFFALYMVNLPNTSETSPVYLTCVNNVACALVLLPFVRSQLAISMTEASLLLLMGAVQLALPYYFFSRGVLTVPLQEAALIALIEPVLNPLWVALFIGELPSAATIAGGSMILVGLGVRYLWPMPREPQVAVR